MKFHPSRLGRTSRYLAALPLVFLSSCGAAPAPQAASPSPAVPAATPAKQGADGAGQWKTAFYKRGFVGVYQAGWADGVGSTIRLRVPIQFEGTKVRVTLTKMRDGETVLSKMTLARAKDNNGSIDGVPRPLLFAGAPGVSIEANAPDVVSDAVDGPIWHGIWYLQESYASEKYLYAYHNDGFFNEAGDRHAAVKLADFKGGCWPGNVTRIEVFTTDTRPTILCYGDSITHGYNSTPDAGASYPEVLGRLTKLPTLNLGVNGDVITYTGGVPGVVDSFVGVESVVVLMGINDIISGAIKDAGAYSKIASSLIAGLKQNGKKVYFGTVTPSGGYAAFDKEPEKEALRRRINEWIREQSDADGVIDFDEALRDPANPTRLRVEYQSDWLHPNDAGYAKMAETAAKFFPVPASEVTPSDLAVPKKAKTKIVTRTPKVKAAN